MIKNKITIYPYKDIIPLSKEYNSLINLSMTTPKDLIEGVILLKTKTDILIDFGTKTIVKVPKKIYLKYLIKYYYILNTSYLITKRAKKNSFSKKNLKTWLEKKLKKGTKVRLSLNIVNSINNKYFINFKESLNHVKYKKLFFELYKIKISKKYIKGYILNPIKGGFSVAIGGLVGFLPNKELLKKTKKKVPANFYNSSMNFIISQLNYKNKNIVLIRP